MELIDQLKRKYSNLNLDYYTDTKIPEIKVSGLTNNKDVELFFNQLELEEFEISDNEKSKGNLLDKDFEKSKVSLSLLNQCIFLRDYIGVIINNEIQVVLSSIRPIIQIEEGLEENPIEIEMIYNGKKLDIKISKESTLIKDIFMHSLWFRETYMQFPVISIKITDNVNFKDVEQDTNNIINCVIFELDYNFNILFEPVKFEKSLSGILKGFENSTYPNKMLKISFKKYIPELIEYYKIAQKINYLPFKFLCYYNIIEYFLDKSAIMYLSKKIKNIVIKPDFHIRFDSYTTELLHLFQNEGQKTEKDVVKINRVIKEFIELSDIRQIFSDDFLDYFKKKSEILNSKVLELEPILFDSQDEFVRTLTNRIYRMRCSIVHSNPDHDPKKAIPFVPSIDNLEKLEIEVKLIQEIAKLILCKNSDLLY